jgi:protein-S-isoprenylcysteine O-methyltransferase Ste14
VSSGRHKVIPPIYFFGSLLASWLLHAFVPVARIVPAPFNWAGAVLVAGGLVLALWAAGLFKRAGTPIKPFTQSTALVTSGVYRFTRNPMYLGMATVLLGEAVLFGTLTAFVPLPLFVWQIQRKFVREEEAFLEGIFGPAYVEYKARVRRWL